MTVPRLVASLAITLLAVALVMPAGAGQPAADEDGDGVRDAADVCPDTASGDFVDADGCGVCPCEETLDAVPWGSHDGYVACVVAAARTQKAAHRGSRRAIRQAVRRAKRSTCGDEARTRCCVYPDDPDLDAETIVGRCRTTTVDECDRLAEDVDAEDAGPGSCTPNPCVY
jgi:hypothetical protein